MAHSEVSAFSRRLRSRGRAYAAYGGVYITASLLLGCRGTAAGCLGRLGAALSLLGAAVFLLSHRAPG